MSKVKEEFDNNKEEWLKLLEENYSVYCASYYIEELEAKHREMEEKLKKKDEYIKTLEKWANVRKT